MDQLAETTLAETLRERYGHLRITGLREIGYGMETRVYRLDTAVMLSHVFTDDAPDPVRAGHYVKRTRSLCRALAGN